VHRRTPLQREQDVEQRVGILAAGEAHHHTIALRDHAEVLDGLADEAAQVSLQLGEGARRFANDGVHRARL